MLRHNVMQPPRIKRALPRERAQQMGKLGGIARAKALSKDERQFIARKAAAIRWGTLWRL